MADAIYKKFSNELAYININNRKHLEIFRQFFDCKYPIHILLNKEKIFEIQLLKKMLFRLKFKFMLPDNLLFKNKKNNLQMILNLHQEELINLESNLLNKLIKQIYFNDIRTIFIVHDKRFLSILSNPSIMSKYLSSEKYNRLKAYIIPTYILNNEVVEHIKGKVENWVFKKNAAGKGEGMLIGKEARLNEIHDVLIKRKFEYIAQPYIDQYLFQFLNNLSAVTINTFNKNHQSLYLVGTMFSVNDIFLGPGLLRGSAKSIINIAQGDTTLFIPFSWN